MNTPITTVKLESMGFGDAQWCLNKKISDNTNLILVAAGNGKHFVPQLIQKMKEGYREEQIIVLRSVDSIEAVEETITLCSKLLNPDKPQIP